MIFISGVHGVGKPYFCNLAKEATGIECYSASSLVKERSGASRQISGWLTLMKASCTCWLR